MSPGPVSFHGAPDDGAYALAERRFRELPDTAFANAPHEVYASFMEFRTRIDADVQAVKRRLFATSLASRDDDKTAARWISAQHRRLARIAYRMVETMRLHPRAEHGFELLSLALHYMGESVKGHIKESHFHPVLHTLMRIALASRRHHEPMQFALGTRRAPCTQTSLYFRALLLARLAGGGLTFAQVEILDAWMWNWMSALGGCDEPPEGAAFRADLDANAGLRCGTRADAGPSLYLARAPIEAVRLEISKEFHLGRMVCAEGDAGRFAVDDHFAALDAIRRNLRGIRHESAGRGKRYAINAVVELHVGLGEVMAKGIIEGAGGVAAIALQPMTPRDTRIQPRMERERDRPDAAVAEPLRRIVQLVDVSDTGACFEGEETDCAEVAVGDLVALRLAPAEPLLVAKIVRRLPAATGGRVVMGLLRLSSAVQAVRARQCSEGEALPDLSLLYVPGEDDAGRQDAYLTSPDRAAQRDLFETTVDEHVFTFRFNRIREAGRGWVMAGFEVIALRRVELRNPKGHELKVPSR
jgi:hypothetical protein